MARGAQRRNWGAGMALAARAWARRRAARRAVDSRPAAPPSWPEGRPLGRPERARRLLAGGVRIGAEAVGPGRPMPWGLLSGGPGDEAWHAMDWLEDLAALGDAPARALAQDWVGAWVERHGGGEGPGWAPRTAARRLLRLVAQARFLLHPRGEGEAALADAVALHAGALAREAPRLPPGADRLAAAAAVLQARLALWGPDPATLRWRDAVAAEAEAAIDAGGGVATRCPEDLLEALALVAGAAAALAAAELAAPPALGAALARGAPVLRALRHGDGGLARFHGGGRGLPGLAEQVLAAAGRPARAAGAAAREAPAPRMGFLRLAAGRTTVVVDAAAPPEGAASGRAHASTLAFEMGSGRRPLVVCCGPGETFGADWARAARATASHATLSLEAASSARFAADPGGGPPRLAEGPRRVVAGIAPAGPEGLRAELAHDGWRARFGLTHARTLWLAPDGAELAGEDVLAALDAADAARLAAAVAAAGGGGLPATLRFHLHPAAVPAAAGGGVEVALPSGEVWRFEAEGARAAIEPSVWLEPGAAAPRATWQVAVDAPVREAAATLRWTWRKVGAGQGGLRDLAPDWDEDS